MLLVAAMFLFASCSMVTNGGPTTAPAGVDVLDKVRSVDILPRGEQPIAAFQASPKADDAASSTYWGSENSEATEARPQQTPNGPGYDLNFENAPVATVLKVTLGDILGLAYTIDPREQATVSLASARPVPRSDIVFVLESALRLSGLALVRDGGGYKVTPLGNATGAGHVDVEARRSEAGYGVSVVPLQYVAAKTILKLMDSFATRAGSVRADSTRNLLLIQGTGPERRTAVETALTFDVDWMKGQSVGIYPINNSGPEPLIAELETIIDSGDNGLSHDLVKLQVISRLNAIMVVTRKPPLLQAVATWIHRLDQADLAKTGVRVYRVRHGDARHLAKVLTQMFGGSASTSTDIADKEVARTTSVAERLAAHSSATSASLSTAASGGNGVSTAFPSGLNSPNGADASGGLDTPTGGRAPVMTNVRITPDTVNNSVLIYASPENYRIISSTLRQLDQPVLQVGIEATIAEVTLTNELSYGVQSYLTSKQLGLKAGQGSILTSTSTSGAVSKAANALLNRAIPGFNFLIGSESQPAIILDALHGVTSVNVLSNPSLVVTNNQPATLQVGDVVPVETSKTNYLSQNGATVSTIDYRNTGIILRVVPRITTSGHVSLEIEQEISHASSSGLTPIVSQRKVKSAVSVANGQTVVLAGLISEDQKGDRSGIPLLDELPGLGDLFSHQSKKGQRTELIIFIRPQIIQTGSDAYQLAEELRSKLRGAVGASITDDLRVRNVR
ncbi:type II secretion system secretin GspD [Bradyrhizobium sp. ERR14]|uniref:type II secretion system secretin GspD n=1 Tax=Bradyrhizobium sp. ERR14 TaxID=2663837 RepID=UPI001611DC43|nr:type II secretion system secretin GspD [Bradyrhizobium sp. ERR14]MBB4398889.1 general secretion pathway protein D [Bradyrhizobium sp. ERR14]